MAAIGSGINPALGRIDYSPFLQGAQMAAQGRMQGSAALTEGISQGFQDYLKKREQNAILEGRNNALLRDISQDPSLSANPEIQKYTAKMAKGGGLTLNDNIKLNAELTTTVEAARNRQEQQARALQMQVNNLQLKQMQQGFDEANRDREAFGKVYKAMADAKKVLTPEEAMSMAVFYGASPSGVAKLLGQSENSAEFQAKMALVKAQTSQIAANNTQVLARTTRLDENQRLAPNGYRFFDAGDGARVLQVLDYETGGWKTEPLKAPATPASLALLEDKMKKTDTIFKEYTAILNSPERDTPEAVKRRNQLTEQYNVVNPKSDMQYNQTRENLDNLWGLNTPMTGVGAAAGGKPSAPTKAPSTPSNIRGVSAAAPGAQPTPAAAPADATATLRAQALADVQSPEYRGLAAELRNPSAAVATQGGFNLIEDMRRTFAGRAQAAPVTTPAVDTTVATPTPAAPPPVDLSAPPSIAAAVRFGDAPPPNPTPAVERALKSAMRWADKNLGPKGKLGLGALAESLSKPAFEAAREQELRLAQELSEKSDTPVKTFNEAMTNFGYRKSGGGQWEYKGPAFRAGTGSGSEETWMRGRIPDALIPSFLNPSPGADFGGAKPAASSAGGEFEPNVFARAAMSAYNALRPKRASPESATIPFGPASMDSTFLDREAQATVQDIYRPFDVAMAERYQTPAQGAVPQIKLSPAAQKIASELRRSSEEGKRERGKAPQFFLEVSSGDDGRRTRERIKLEENELFGILNSRSPSLAPQLYIDKEASWKMTGRKTGNFRPPPLRAR